MPLFLEKSPSYAALVMRLINTQPHGSPIFLPPNLEEHVSVSPQNK